MTKENEKMIDMWKKGFLSHKGKDKLIDMLINPDTRNFKQEQSESMKFTDHDSNKHKRYDARKLSQKERRT